MAGPGLVGERIIRDTDGNDWVHDVNPRVWGSFAAFRPANVDLVAAHVDWLPGHTLPGSGAPSASSDPLRSSVPKSRPHSSGEADCTPISGSFGLPFPL
jgi:hypothetical protein